MVPLHVDTHPLSKCVLFVPKRYPFTITANGVSTPRMRSGKEWSVVGSYHLKSPTTINNSNAYDMFALIDVEGSGGVFTISY